jgi:hypothetical protein
MKMPLVQQEHQLKLHLRLLLELQGEVQVPLALLRLLHKLVLLSRRGLLFRSLLLLLPWLPCSLSKLLKYAKATARGETRLRVSCIRWSTSSIDASVHDTAVACTLSDTL